MKVNNFSTRTLGPNFSSWKLRACKQIFPRRGRRERENEDIKSVNKSKNSAK